MEELLRWETPVTGVAAHHVRTPKSRLPHPGGQDRHVLLGSANTDGAEFAAAESVDFDRPANRHLAFGGGVHRCLGSHLARLELRVGARGVARRGSPSTAWPTASS